MYIVILGFLIFAKLCLEIKKAEFLLYHFQFQNDMKMTDEETLFLFLIKLYLLKQNRRLNSCRLLLHSFLFERMRILEKQRVIAQHFTHI